MVEISGSSQQLFAKWSIVQESAEPRLSLRLGPPSVAFPHGYFISAARFRWSQPLPGLSIHVDLGFRYVVEGRILFQFAGVSTHLGGLDGSTWSTAGRDADGCVLLESLG